ncbi:hypothetical protein QUF80_03475 [Desulfococcaceae bacterium HSG8]|nr:hypothetical protein [Desulfococcaceae bacterium HSG8]
MKNAVAVLLMIIALDSVSFGDVLIIANKDVPETILSQKEVREIFLGKRVQWSDNSRIRFVVISNPELHSMFLKKYVRLPHVEWEIYWKRIVFTGRGMPPETINSETEMVEFISKKHGAVGYVSSGAKLENREIKIIGDQ